MHIRVSTQRRMRGLVHVCIHAKAQIRFGGLSPFGQEAGPLRPRLSVSPNSYQNGLRMLQGREMTNVTRETAETGQPLFIGVDMVKREFVWNVHGERATHSVANDEQGFACLDAVLRDRVLGLVVLGHGRSGAQAGGASGQPRRTGGGGQSASRTRVCTQPGAPGQDGCDRCAGLGSLCSDAGGQG